jgi:predicted esterase
LSLPLWDESSFLTPGETGIAPWLSQSADGASGFRTNVGLVLPDTTGGKATLLILGPRGEELGRKTFEATAPTFFQESVRNIAAAGEIGRLTLQVERGRAQAYTSVVDNVTGDSSVFTVKRSFNTPLDAIVAGLARTPGANGTYFVSDVRLVNPTGSSATVTLRFLGDAPVNPVNLTLLPMESRELRDVLALFALPEGSSGAVRFTSPAALLVAARTSNVDRNGLPGSYGAQQDAVGLDSFSFSSAVLTAVVQDEKARTNVGFLSGSSGAVLALTLRDANGVTMGSTTLTFQPLSWIQANVAQLFGLTRVERGSTLEITPSSGSFSAYASLVDQRSGDASVSRALPAACVTRTAIAGAEQSCRSANVTLTATEIAGATYSWSVSGGTIVSGAGTRSVVVAPGGGASLTATAQVTTASGCVSRVLHSVALSDGASLSNVIAKSGSVGREIMISWSASQNLLALELKGTDFPNSIAIDPTARSYSYVPQSAGTKSFTLTATTACGSVSSTNLYQVAAAPPSGRASGGSGGGFPGLQTFPGARGRDYVVYVPKTYDPAVPASLVFALGGQGEPASMTLAVGWQTIAERDNVLVVTMTAATSGPGYEGAYDVAEFETIELAELEVPQRYNVALQHVYYWGFSAGAHVTYMFALTTERSNRLAAFAIHAGAIEAAATRIDPPSWPPQPGARHLPVFISCGQNDTSGSGGGLIGALRRNRDMLLAAGYPVQTREVPNQGHTYASSEVNAAWSFLKMQALPN